MCRANAMNDILGRAAITTDERLRRRVALRLWSSIQFETHLMPCRISANRINHRDWVNIVVEELDLITKGLLDRLHPMVMEDVRWDWVSIFNGGESKLDRFLSFERSRSPRGGVTTVSSSGAVAAGRPVRLPPDGGTLASIIVGIGRYKSYRGNT